MDEEVRKAFETIGAVLNQKKEEALKSDRTEEEIRESIQENMEMLSYVNKISGNQLSGYERCSQLIDRLLKIEEDGGAKVPFPSQEEIDTCIDYLLREARDMLMLASLYGNLGAAYKAVQERLGNSRYNEEIYSYYYKAIVLVASLIETLSVEERNAGMEVSLGISLTEFLYDISAVVIEIKKEIDLKYVKMGCEYAIKNNDLMIAKYIANNYLLMYSRIKEYNKGQEIAIMLLEIYKKIIDQGLEHDLELFIKNAQAYSDIYRFKLNRIDKEAGQGFLYAAYYAEHSKEKNAKYRNYQCAISYYWYAKYANEPVYSKYWEKAYTYASKFLFNKECSAIVKEYRELKRKI